MGSIGLPVGQSARRQADWHGQLQRKADLAMANGAWATIDYTKENVVERVRELTQGEMCDVVYDSVGKDTWEMSLDCLKPAR
ncbi:hypothetical protein DK37_04320 [Halomonas sp. SUBG004]|nr:hypothetical protein DK37_04320 [Halomonas sp. SUBG004]